MKFFTQLQPSGIWKEGDCVTASLASFLEIPVAQMENLTGLACEQRLESQTAAVQRILRQHGYESDLYYQLPDPVTGEHRLGEPFTPKNTDGLAITMCRLSRGDYKPFVNEVTHCVVMQDGELYWDPFPDWDLSLGEPYAWVFPKKDGKRVFSNQIPPEKGDFPAKPWRVSSDGFGEFEEVAVGQWFHLYRVGEAEFEMRLGSKLYSVDVVGGEHVRLHKIKEV